MKLLSGRDYDTPVAAAQIDHFFAGLEIAKLQHFHDDGFGSRIIGRQLRGVLRLGRCGA